MFLSVQAQSSQQESLPMPSSSSFNTYSNLLNPEFRAKIDAMLAQFEAAFYAKIENAAHRLLINEGPALPVHIDEVDESAASKRKRPQRPR
jgi:ABC-type oligopeptide transport system substrate-binding subunit